MYDHLNVVSNHFPFIPPEAFLYQPISKNLDIENQSTQSLQTDDYIIKTKDNQIKRLIFQGDTKFTKFENTKLNEFQQYIQRKNITIDPRWNRSWRLRWIQSTNYDNKQAVQDMKNYIEYLDKNKEIVLKQKVQKCLKAGVFYLAGRDSKYRPILILDVKKMIKFNLKEEEIYQCQVYFFEFIMRNMLIPGQVEMWVTIIDVGYQGVMSMIGPMKSSISFLQSTFRSRMYVGYIIRPSGTCSFLWSIAQKFLQQDTKRKIVFVEEQPMKALLEYCNPSQLQKKFGGTLQIEENNCWPLKPFSENYQSKTERTILSLQEYQQKFHQKKLLNTKVYQPFVKPPTLIIQENFNVKVESKTKQISSQFLVEKVQVKAEIKKLTVNLIEVGNQVVSCLEKLKEEDLSFLQALNLQTQNLCPDSGFDWLIDQTPFPN